MRAASCTLGVLPKPRRSLRPSALHVSLASHAATISKQQGRSAAASAHTVIGALSATAVHISQHASAASLH